MMDFSSNLKMLLQKDNNPITKGSGINLLV